MKYAQIIGILLITTVGGLAVLYYPTDARVKSSILSGYSREIHTLTTAIETDRKERERIYLDWKRQDESLSGSITEKKGRSEKVQLCLDAQSMDCESGKKEAMLSLIPRTYAESITQGTGTTPQVVPPERTGSQNLPLECELWLIGKIEGIEFHYTDTDDDTTLQAIKNGHQARFGIEHIGYHYVIKPDGEITNTRDEKCVAAADKWSRNNYRFIQVSFIGNDKPTTAQTVSMIALTKSLQKKYTLPLDTVSAHNEWGPKSAHESLEYWYWSKDEFIKKLRLTDHISIYGKDSPELSYMWQAWGDKDFIGTIFQESRMSNTTIGDGGQSIGYCQFHQGFNPWWAREYLSLQTMEDRLNYCHEKYTYASTLPGGVGSRFHWWDKREKHIQNISIY
jgi:N-acetylmuramoyl-L-alanine amidase